MTDRNHALSVTKQAEAVGIARSTVYYLPRPVSADDLALMKQIDSVAGGEAMTHDIAVIFSTHGLANVIFGQGRVGKGPLPLVTPVLV